MMIVYDSSDLEEYMRKAVIASPERPILIDKFLEEAIEVDVDCVSDGKDSIICGIMEHIDEAGVHSGDSACRGQRGLMNNCSLLNLAGYSII